MGITFKKKISENVGDTDQPIQTKVKLATEEGEKSVLGVAAAPETVVEAVSTDESPRLCTTPVSAEVLFQKFGLIQKEMPRKLRPKFAKDARFFERTDYAGTWNYVRDHDGQWYADMGKDPVNCHLNFKWDAQIGIVNSSAQPEPEVLVEATARV